MSWLVLLYPCPTPSVLYPCPATSILYSLSCSKCPIPLVLLILSYIPLVLLYIHIVMLQVSYIPCPATSTSCKSCSHTHCSLQLSKVFVGPVYLPLESFQDGHHSKVLQEERPAYPPTQLCSCILNKKSRD